MTARTLVRRKAFVALALSLATGGCSLAECRLETIVVTAKDARQRPERRVRGYIFMPHGDIVEDREVVVARDYWVKGEDGRWRAVGESTWQRAVVGQPLDVCR